MNSIKSDFLEQFLGGLSIGVLIAGFAFAFLGIDVPNPEGAGGAGHPEGDGE